MFVSSWVIPIYEISLVAFFFESPTQDMEILMFEYVVYYIL
jgi:hypothetical protein